MQTVWKPHRLVRESVHDLQVEARAVEAPDRDAAALCAQVDGSHMYAAPAHRTACALQSTQLNVVSAGGKVDRFPLRRDEPDRHRAVDLHPTIGDLHLDLTERAGDGAC